MNFLAGDLGGTKTLLAIYSCGKKMTKIYQKRYLSSEWSSFEEIIINFIKNLPVQISPPNYGCIAVAGPVFNGKAKITNLDWQIEDKSICSYASLEKVEIINDFSVLIHGLPYLDSNQQVEIQSPAIEKTTEGTVAIIGAGTGLGMTKGLITPKGIFNFPSEGGHSEFAPRSENEWKLALWLKSDLNLKRLSIERVVSGTGLGNIANWLLNESKADSHPLRPKAQAWRYGKNSKVDLPSLVSKAAQEGDPLMKVAIEIWLNAYGSAAGDLALQELCNAGLWIGGGTAIKHLEGLRSQTFIKGMQNKGRFKKFIQQLPVMALIDPEAGIFSAACRARSIAQSNGKLT